MRNLLFGISAIASTMLLAAVAHAQNPGCQNCQANYGGIVESGESCGHGAVCRGGRCHALLGRCGFRGRPGAADRLHETWQGPVDNWHGQYYHTSYGSPVALVAPPTASLQSKWSWGVGNTAVVPIYNQFGRQYPGPAAPGGMGNGYAPTPRWPSNTDQFGVHYVRGPW